MEPQSPISARIWLALALSGVTLSGCDEAPPAPPLFTASPIVYPGEVERAAGESSSPTFFGPQAELAKLPQSGEGEVNRGTAPSAESTLVAAAATASEFAPATVAPKAATSYKPAPLAQKSAADAQTNHLTNGNVKEAGVGTQIAWLLANQAPPTPFGVLPSAAELEVAEGDKASSEQTEPVADLGPNFGSSAVEPDLRIVPSPPLSPTLSPPSSSTSSPTLSPLPAPTLPEPGTVDVPITTPLNSAQYPHLAAERGLPPRVAEAFAPKTTGEPVGANSAEIRQMSVPSQAGSEMAAVARQTQAKIQAAAQLSQRGAFFSARQEFLQALAAVAGELDRQQQTTAHQRALQAGLTALDETGELLSGTSPQRNWKELTAGHQTPLPQTRDLGQMTVGQAGEAYLTFAREQLSIAGGDVLPAADALFGLGKLHMQQGAGHHAKSLIENARAMTLFQTALIIEPKHAMAANELGVMFARIGRLQEAKSALQESAALSGHPATWGNLASVHRDLGEYQLSQLAQRESQLAQQRWQKQAQQTGQLAQGAVQVVDQGTFAKSAPLNYDVNPPSQAAAATNNSVPRYANNPPNRSSANNAAANRYPTAGRAAVEAWPAQGTAQRAAANPWGTPNARR